MIWDILIPLVTLILGAIGGALVTGKMLTKRFIDMQSDPKMIQKLAMSMGRKMSVQQATQLSAQMKQTTKKKLNEKKEKTPKK